MRAQIYYRDTETSEDGHPVYHLKMTRPDTCPECGSTKLQSIGVTEKRLTGCAPDGAYEEVVIHGNRYKCAGCGKTFLPTLDRYHGKYSEDFLQYLCERFKTTTEETEKLAPGFIDRSEKGADFVSGLIKRYYSYRKESALYRMPRHLGLIFFSMERAKLFALCDVKSLKVLDVMGESALKRIDLTGVKDILLYNPEKLKKVRGISGEIPVIIPRPSDFMEQVGDTLYEDIFDIPMPLSESDHERIYEILTKGHPKEMLEETLRESRLLPLYHDFSLIFNHLDRLHELDGLKVRSIRLREFLETAKKYIPAVYGIRPELAETFFKRAHAFKNRAESYKRMSLTPEKARGNLLFCGTKNRSYLFEPDGKGEDNIALDFGIPL